LFKKDFIYIDIVKLILFKYWQHSTDSTFKPYYYYSESFFTL